MGHTGVFVRTDLAQAMGTEPNEYLALPKLCSRVLSHFAASGGMDLFRWCLLSVSNTCLTRSLISTKRRTPNRPLVSSEAMMAAMSCGMQGFVSLVARFAVPWLILLQGL